MVRLVSTIKRESVQNLQEAQTSDRCRKYFFEDCCKASQTLSPQNIRD